MRLFRGRKALVLALVFGVVAALISYRYIQQQAASATVKTTTVLVAAQDIPTRTKITAALVKEVQIPVSAKHPNAVTALKDAEGNVTRLPITAGEQILFQKFAAERTQAGLSFVVPPSKRAVSIKVTETTGSGGLIQPGDHVDVIGVFDAKTMGKDMSVFVLQDIEVLAVAQTMQDAEDSPGPAEQAAGLLGGGASKASAAEAKPKVQPDAKSITVAVDPEQAQRLVLAEERGKLRVALRPYKEDRIVDLGEATLSTIQSPLKQGQATITAVSISPAELRAGETMKVEITVKNTSTTSLRSQSPDPGYTYSQGQTFYSQNYPSQSGAYRVGLNFAGQAPIEFPYRWGFGSDLPPGSSVTVQGFIKFTTDFKATNFWAGLISEPSNIVQDNVGVTQVTVAASNRSIVTVDSAQLRSGPSVSSAAIDTVGYGTEVTILGQEGDWYKVEVAGTGKQGYLASGWLTAGR